MANTTIQLKFSTVASNTPSSLANGELAINGADGKLFYRTPSGTIQSIVTYPGPAGLNKEIQFNDSGVAGSNSALTFDKASASLNVTNINVTTRITTGGGAGGTIAGANAIFANSFIANTGGITTTGNSTLNGIVTVNYNVGATSSQNVAIEMYGANTKGGTGYFDFIVANNISGGATSRNKWFRLSTNGDYQIINSAYTLNIFNLDDSGNVVIPGYFRIGSGYIQFADGSRQYTANAGSGALSNTQILAGLQTVSNTANITFDYVATANNGQGFNFKVGDDAWIGDINTADTMSVRGQQNAANAYIVFGNADSTSKLGRAGSGPLTYAGNTVWHAGNDGTGSGLDADLLDGLDSASFANAAFANTVTAFARGGTNAISYTTGAFLTSNGTSIVSVANTGTAGTYGNTTYIPVITTDAYGRVSSVTNTAISFPTSTDTLQTVTTRGSTTSNAINITNTTASTSKTTGALIVAGGAGFAGNVSTLGINIDNRIDWPAAGYAPPSLTNRSAGTKLVLYPSISASIVDYAIGVDASTVWTSVPDATGSYFFKWYGGTAQIASLSGAGLFTTGTINVTSGTASTSNATGALQVSGGIGVTGNVYSSNVFTRGDIVAGLADGVVLAGATNPIFAAIGNTNSYVQNYVVNYSNTANASADWAAYPNNGSDASGWIDMGITSNNYSQAGYNTTGRNEGYILMSAPSGSGTSGNLVFATDVTGTLNSIEFYANGFNQSKGTADLVITKQTISTSNSTGAILINGGAGVKGNVVADNVYVGANPVATIPDVLALAIALG
jgi:hypothetical protein